MNLLVCVLSVAMASAVVYPGVVEEVVTPAHVMAPVAHGVAHPAHLAHAAPMVHPAHLEYMHPHYTHPAHLYNAMPAMPAPLAYAPPYWASPAFWPAHWWNYMVPTTWEEHWVKEVMTNPASTDKEKEEAARYMQQTGAFDGYGF